jgi:hypothetical protein
MGRRTAIRWDAALAVLGLLATACPQLRDDDFGKDQSQRPNNREPPLDAGDGVEADTTAPRVVASSPPADARGVLPDAPIELSFSEAMDTAATELAYGSSDIPRAGVTFTWTQQNTVLVIRPGTALSHASGSDPATAHHLTLSGARDAAGNALAPFELTFHTARDVTQSFESVKDRDLTGNWRSNGSYGIEFCEKVDTTVCVGDSLDTDEPAYRGFISFDLGALPADRVAIESAELSLTVSLLAGTPFTGLGSLQLEPLHFQTIGEEAFGQSGDAEPTELAATALQGQVLRSDVTASVQAADADEYCQFRLRFERDTDPLETVTVDLITSDWTTQRLAVTYWVP